LDLTRENEAFEKEVIGRRGSALPNYRIYISRKGLVINQLTRNHQKGVTAMKNRNMFIRCLLFVMLLAIFVACDSPSKQERAGEYVDDSVITTKVKSLLAADDILKSFDITVETNKGNVQLSGLVDSQKTVDKAGEIAKGVSGVKSVKNSLIVKK
jgi:hyperosmotically inducible protein